MATRQLDPRIKKLKDEGNQIWSYSKLGTFHNCKFAYKLNYMTYPKIENKDNIYSVLGSVAHDILEEAYNTKTYDGVKANEKFNLELDNILNRGLVFSKDEDQNKNIYNNYVKSMTHFFLNFKLEDYKCKQEGLLIKHLFGKNYIQGFYDQLRNYQESLEVIDFKTSTIFKGADRDDKAKQLILYADILNGSSKHKIDRVGWHMLKYLVISYQLKNGKTKETIALRSEWVSKLEKQLEKDLSAMDMDDLEINAYISEAVRNNNLDSMPEIIRLKYTIKDYYDWYEFDESHVKEVYKYIEGTIKAIESEEKWEANTSKENSYYCNNLCGFSYMCPYIASKNDTVILDDEELDDLL